MSYHPFRLLSVFVVTLVFALPLSLSFDSDAHGQDDEAKKYYSRANYFFSEKSYKKAARFYKKATDKGHAESQYKLGFLSEGWYSYDSKTYKQYSGVRQNFKKAAEWYRKSAEQGYFKAQLALGKMYGEGRGVEQDSEQAIKLYHEAAEQGYFEAQYQLGYVYYLGKFSIQKNHAKAAKWYGEATEPIRKHRYEKTIGKGNALYLLGKIYTKGGYGVEQDCAQAVSWYDKLAELRFSYVGESKTQLADDYLSGNKPCLKKDHKQAIKFYISAMKEREETSIEKLIDIYTKGEIVKKSPSTIYALYLMYDNVTGELKAEKFRKTLTKKQLDEGVRLWAKWRT